ncbi:Chlorophyll a-b binding protein [Psidium guajava]|nr:Chlorophyll a-b binding protein [Psidium guajava]
MKPKRDDSYTERIIPRVCIKYVPGSLYAICAAHRRIDGLCVWRMRSHAYPPCSFMVFPLLFPALFEFATRFPSLNSIFMSDCPRQFDRGMPVKISGMSTQFPSIPEGMWCI